MEELTVLICLEQAVLFQLPEEKSDEVQALIQQDRRITMDQMVTELDIIHGTAWHILIEKLGMKKLYSRWIPCVLTEGNRRSTEDLRAHISSDSEEIQLS